MQFAHLMPSGIRAIELILFFLFSFGEHLDPQQTQQRPGSAHSSASSQRWKRLSENSFTWIQP